MKTAFSELYFYLQRYRLKLTRKIVLAMLILSIIVGAGYRMIILNERFSYPKESLGHIIIMASNYMKAPGMYNWEEYMLTREKPEEYVYTKGKSRFPPTSPENSDIGWALILHLFLREGIKGIHNIALFIARYQVMIDLSVIVVLFFAGKSIAGVLGAFLASFLYAVFKVPMVQMSEVYYYYWTIPFSALSLLFWAVIYRPKEIKNDIRLKYLYFFCYGIVLGFATFLRLFFLFLPLFMSPLIFMREKVFKKGVILLVIILLGQSMFLFPMALYNKKHFGKLAIATRGHWHLFLQGLAFSPNPWGITDSGDVGLNEWAKAKGAPDMFKGIEESERWYKKEYFKMFKEHPKVFTENFLRHLKSGFTVNTNDFEFFGIIENQRMSMFMLIKIFPWICLSALGILFIFSRERFWIMTAVLLQGLYLLLVVVTWFTNHTPFIAGYIPVFILLLAVSVAVHIKFFIALLEGSILCWLNSSGIKKLPKIMIDCYRKGYGESK